MNEVVHARERLRFRASAAACARCARFFASARARDCESCRIKMFVPSVFTRACSDNGARAMPATYVLAGGALATGTSSLAVNAPRDGSAVSEDKPMRVGE